MGRERTPGRFRSEAGFTLTELLVATLLGLIVVGAAVQFLIVSVHSRPQAQSRSAGIQQARFTMDQITRELRQGSTVSTATASQLSMVTYVHQATCGGAASTTGIVCQVKYTCSAGTCTRAVGTPGSSPTGGKTVATGLSSSNVFSYETSLNATSCDQSSATSPVYVCVTLAFPAANGKNAITLNDAVALRNVTTS
jgi:Tfp pilus assembly protein PilW